MTIRKRYLVLLLASMGIYTSAQDLNIFLGRQLISQYSYTNTSIEPYFGGLYSNIKLYKGFYFQPGLSYSPKGGDSYNGAATKWNYSERVRTSYLEIPLLVALRTPGDYKTRFMVAAGPFVAVGLNGSRSYYNDHSEWVSENPFTTGFQRRFDLGFSAKVGIEIQHFSIYSGASVSVLKGKRNYTLNTVSVSYRLLDLSNMWRKSQNR